jgi:hypothetical protein
MLEQRLSYLSLLPIENDIAKSLLYEEAIETYSEKNVGEKVL